MKFTDEQMKQLEEALRVIDNVHHDVSNSQGENSQEFESVNAIWCILDNTIKGVGI